MNNLDDKPWRQALWNERIVYEYSSPGKTGILIEDDLEDLPVELPENAKRHNVLKLPEISEVEVARHYTRLSQMSYGVDLGPVPLGSCTMKYNPKISEDLANRDETTWLHPLQPDEDVQGILEILYELQSMLALLTGMDECSLVVPAGASGELAGALMIKKYLIDTEQFNRDEMIVPDSAHGTNPASARMAGFKVITIPSNTEGTVDLKALKSITGAHTAGIMLTNPNTLGVFEKDILEISRLIHGVGGKLYYDGANLNGILGIARPGDMGFDTVHINLHKTFSTPHGGGGPGGGAVCAKGEMVKYLPKPIVKKRGKRYYLDQFCEKCIGYMHSFYGNIPVDIKAYAYIKSLGGKGLRQVALISTLNTNYFKKLIEGIDGYTIPYDPIRPRKHEIVISAYPLKEKYGITADDVAKYLLDNGFYAPTIYFPLIVREALMIEFTESETKENIERYVDILKEIKEVAEKDPERIGVPPKNTVVRKIKAAEANKPRNIIPTYRVLAGKREGVVKYEKL
ncbi:MAG: aminomethyl-transferring glycine dehydrogenase subunit GcvPB [Desulfurococcales archaeon]|nr:aminomethyl-transferring glycine dehydrogenase subunit GcvPB [Desulfurococcales archaeon]